MNERHYAQMFLALERIKLYQSPERLRKRSAKDWGLDDPNEAIEMAYENVLQEAKNGLRGVKRPALFFALKRSSHRRYMRHDQ
jgi:hypothetical protein